MKTILALLALMLLSVGSSMAGQIYFPGPNHEYVLSIYTDHITIWDLTGVLPDCYPADNTPKSCIWAHNPTSRDMAVRNAWLAALLQAKTTGIPVIVIYAETADNPAAAPPRNIGSIIEVRTQP